MAVTSDIRRRRAWRDRFHDAFLTSLNRRSDVETVLWAVAAGKRGPIEADEARALAIKLGVPKEWIERRDADMAAARQAGGS
jgi:hypothetical protein